MTSTPGWLDRLAVRCRDFAGWRGHGVACAAGALAAAALPPVHAIPLLLIAFPVLVWRVDGSPTGRAAFFAGWWFGFGHFLVGLYWISHALLTDPARYGWMIPFAVGGLSAVLAVFPALATLLVWRARWHGAGRILLLAASWTAMEWARGHVLTGFPWNLMGNVWTAVPPMMQFAALAGVYGLSLFTVLVAASPAALVGRERLRWAPVGLASALLAALWAGGAIRLADAPRDMVAGVTLRIVQPNIRQHHKWRDDQRAANFAKLMRLSRVPAERPLSAVIWPETAAPFFVAANRAQRRIMAAAAPDGGLLITGAMRITPRQQQPFRIWNSVHAVDGAGIVRATYDKFHLVPFGEYVPFRRWIDLPKITPGVVDFSRGPGPMTVALDGLPPVSPLICYEAIFTGDVARTDDRPGWLLNLTNDGWFGISSGPHQHLSSARLRAVEEGLPLVRAANTGISAVFDGYGRWIAGLGLGEEGVVDAPLPAALASPPPYARIGDWAVLALLAAAIAAGVAVRRA